MLEAWNRQIGDRVAGLFGFRLHEVLFVRRGTLPKTTSGKVRRSALRRLHENEELETLWRQPAPAQKPTPSGERPEEDNARER